MTYTMPLEAVAATLAEGSAAEITVVGSSMYPLFRSGRDSVCLRPISAAPKIGDIILYRRKNGKYVMHRIVGKNADGFILAGDNQMQKEYAVTADMVIARADTIIRSTDNGDKRIPVTALWYRVYTLLWTRMFFARPFFAKCIKAAARVKHSVK